MNVGRVSPPPLQERGKSYFFLAFLGFFLAWIFAFTATLALTFAFMVCLLSSVIVAWPVGSLNNKSFAPGRVGTRFPGHRARQNGLHALDRHPALIPHLLGSVTRWGNLSSCESPKNYDLEQKNPDRQKTSVLHSKLIQFVQHLHPLNRSISARAFRARLLAHVASG